MTISLTKQQDVYYWIERGHKCVEKKNYADALVYFKTALALDPFSAAVLNNVGQVKQQQRRWADAERFYKSAIKQDPSFLLPYKNLATLHYERGRYKQAKHLLLQHLRYHPDTVEFWELLTNFAMNAGQLREAARYAGQLATLRHKYISSGKRKLKTEEAIYTEPAWISRLKIKHDLAQFRYLAEKKVKISALKGIIKAYSAVYKKLENVLPDETRILLDPVKHRAIYPYYNKIIYQPPTPRVKHALNPKPRTFKNDHLGMDEATVKQLKRLDVRVIDDFLSQPALQALRRFCNESTMWFENSYSHGRLGAFFRRGFNCPLLVQIGEEIRAAFPDLIKKEHALLQIWGFKCDAKQPPIAPHADFASVNVNFWITPESHNLAAPGGGMILYDVEAPLHWNFDAYNNQGQKIRNYLKSQKARSVAVPYKSNRAVVFHSDLFHVTAPVHFEDSYPARRINITLLFGKRENAVLAIQEEV
ncbi:MAG: tetratricopeptide repeat protein [Sediminibacterium sp.]|nr:tetratricopeptide repeat protein [Sediminibacterium sp.]